MKRIKQINFLKDGFNYLTLNHLFEVDMSNEMYSESINSKGMINVIDELTLIKISSNDSDKIQLIYNLIYRQRGNIIHFIPKDDDYIIGIDLNEYLYMGSEINDNTVIIKIIHKSETNVISVLNDGEQDDN